VVFRNDDIYEGYLPGQSTPLITDHYSIDENGNITGRFVGNPRIGRIEAHLESNDKILYFAHIEENAFDNPTNVNGVVVLECRGPNPTK